MSDIVEKSKQKRQKALDAFLAARRFSVETLEHFGWMWSQLGYGRRPHFLYPAVVGAVPGRDCRTRAKFLDGGDPKYLWGGDSSKEKPNYYNDSAGFEAARGGTLIIASGEPDVLGLWEVGYRNVVCWFGEGQQPRDFLDKLKEYDIRKVITFTDCDVAGDGMARKLLDTISGVAVGYEPAKVPGEWSETGGPDLGDFWKNFEGDIEAFRAALDELPLLEIPELEKKAKSGVAGGGSASDELLEIERRCRLLIAQHMTPRRGKRGQEGYYECPLDHGDEGKDFLFFVNAGEAIGGCQGKHGGQLTLWKDLTDFVCGVGTVTRIAREVANEKRVMAGGGSGPPPMMEEGPPLDPADVLAGDGPEEIGKHGRMVALGNLCSRIAESENGDRPTLLREALGHLRHLDEMEQVFMLKDLASASKLTMAQIKGMLNLGGAVESESLPNFWIKDGCMWRRGANDVPHQISNFVGRWVARRHVSQGDNLPPTLDQELEITTQSGQRTRTWVEAKHTGAGEKLLSMVVGAVGSDQAWVLANEQRHLMSAIGILTNATGEVVVEENELQHTGWIENKGEMVYVTPGGAVGDLPEGTSVRIIEGDSGKHYAVVDEGDEQWERGLKALWAMLDCFPAAVAFPAVAFGFLPPMGRWVSNKFVLHFVGRTGTYKTTYGQLIMSLYGRGWATAEPNATWNATANGLTRIGYPYKDCMVMVDDFKLQYAGNMNAKAAGVIHSYVSGKERTRLRRDSRVMEQKPFRGWAISTGEDMWTDPAVQARTVALRFQPLEAGIGSVPQLAEAQQYVDGLQTVMARFVAWLAANPPENLNVEMVRLRGQLIPVVGGHEDVANAGRIAENMATLILGWRYLWRFLVDAGLEMDADFIFMRDSFEVERDVVGAVVLQAIERITQGVKQEQPTRRFVEAVEHLCQRGHLTVDHRDGDKPGTVIWYDDEGLVYVASGVYEDVEKHLRQAGVALGMHRGALYSLFAEEGWLAETGKDNPRKQIRLGGRPVRVLVFEAEKVNIAMEGDDEEIAF